MIQQMGGAGRNLTRSMNFAPHFVVNVPNRKGEKSIKNQHDGVLPESFEVHAENHCNFLYKTSISSNRDEIIWPYNVSIQGR